MTPVLRDSLSTAVTLLVFALLGAGLLSGTFGLTRGTIEATERANRQRLIAETLPGVVFDNDLVAAARPLAPDPQLGLKRPGLAYVARLGTAARAVVLDVVAPDGYSGEIRLLVGVGTDGRVTGVRVTAHRETPGLGDYIEASKSNWINQFTGRSLTDPTPETWRVRKDGGRFDYMAGATITPRAVVKAVRRSLEYFAQHREALLAPPSPQPREQP